MNAKQISEESTMTQPAKPLYTAKAHTRGGRDRGASRTSDGLTRGKPACPWLSARPL